MKKKTRNSLFHIHWMNYHHETKFNVYLECRCGKRERHHKPLSLGYEPIDTKWLEGKDIYFEE